MRKKSRKARKKKELSHHSGSQPDFNNNTCLPPSDFKPVIFTGMDVLDFLGKSAFCSSIIAVFGAVFWLAGLFAAERLVGFLAIFAIMGIPILLTGKKDESSPIILFKLIAVLFTVVFFFLSLALLVPLMPLENIIKKDSYRTTRQVFGLVFFPLLIVISQLFDFSFFYVWHIAFGSMGLASILILTFPETENDLTRTSIWAIPPDEEKNKKEISSVLPLPESKPIILYFQTSWQKFLDTIIWISGSIVLISLVCWVFRLSLIPSWITSDALTAINLTLVLLYFSRACYVVLPSQKKLIRFTMNPLLAETNEINSQELAGVVLGCSYRSCGFFQRKLNKVYEINLLFMSGVKLEIPLPSMSGFSENEIETHLEAYSRRLSDILNCRFLNLLVPATFEEWKSHQENFFSVIPGEPLPPFFNNLWRLYCAGKFFDIPSDNEFEVVKSDLNTFWELLLLGFVSLLFTFTTILMLSYEWDLLIGNPRFFYLILLDCSSIIVTVMSLWRCFIDEYYIFDLNRREILFYSRILFFKRKIFLGNFSEISHLVLEESAASIGFNLYRYRIKLVLDETGREIIIGRSSSEESMKSRIIGLAQLLKTKILQKPLKINAIE